MRTNITITTLVTAAVLLAGGLPVATSTSAAAEPASKVDVRADDVRVVGATCRRGTIVAKGDWGEEADGNKIIIKVRGPRGGRITRGTLDDDGNGWVRTDVRLCGWDTPGRYRVRVKVVSFDDPRDSWVGATTHFRLQTLPKRSSRILRTVSRIHQGQYLWAVVGRLRRAGQPYGPEKVRIQVLYFGSWYNVGSQYTSQKGRFGWIFKPNRYAWRYVYRGNETTRGSVSTPFRTPGRGKEGPAPASLASLLTGLTR